MSELTRIQIVVALQSCDLFVYCKAEEILRIAGIAHERPFEVGQTIYEKNDPPGVLYAIVHGEVRLEGGEGEANSVGALRTFGVREILCGRLRRETAIATQETLALAIEADDFFDLLANNIDIIKALFRHMLHEEDV